MVDHLNKSLTTYFLIFLLSVISSFFESKGDQWAAIDHSTPPGWFFFNNTTKSQKQKQKKKTVLSPRKETNHFSFLSFSFFFIYYIVCVCLL